MSSPNENGNNLKTISHPLEPTPNHGGQNKQEDAPKSEKNPFYLDLIDSTKQQMSLKFDELARETGLDLRNSPDLSSNHISKNVNNNSILENENKHLREELRLKNEILAKMFKIRSQVESELEDLTVSLFEEANKMVYKANVTRERLEKDLIEANLKIDMLTAEVQALKLLVITSAPSKPSGPVYPQLNSPVKRRVIRAMSQNLPSRSPSNYELGDNANGSANQSDNLEAEANDLLDQSQTNSFNTEMGEVDPILLQEFNEWRKSPTLEPVSCNFMKRIYDEDIYPVLNFKNKDLTSGVLRAIENNSLTLELINNGDRQLPFPKKCALLEVQRLCHYRMRLGEQPKWHPISHLCRNRIANVCDLFCYLRYILNGLVKSPSKDIFWQIMIKRKKIAASKLGFLDGFGSL